MATVPGFDRITVDAGKMGGRPCIRGMRLTVKRVLQVLATYDSRDEIRAEFPELEEEDLQQALDFAAALADLELVELDAPPPGRDDHSTAR